MTQKQTNEPDAQQRIAELEAALRETLQVMYDLQGMAFVGSHTPRDREPLLVRAKQADINARAVLRKEQS